MVSVGIDIAEPRKGLDLVALDGERNVLASRGGMAVDEAASATLALQPAVVCIDSPSGWSASGRSRMAERELSRLGIQSYRTGPDPGDHPFYRWMRVGFEMFKRLAPAYPLYRGGDVTGRAAEVFPHATACLLAGHLRPPGTPKHTVRRQILRRVDAALGALTGLIALAGGHSVVGDPDEGVILLPVSRLPPGPLRAPKRHQAQHRR